MPLFSPKSLERLRSCHAELQVLFCEVIKHWDCTVLEGHRNQADQEQAFASGNTKLHFPHGKHNSVPSRAVDVSPYPIDWKDSQRFHLFAGFVLGVASQLRSSGIMKHEVRWGGDWDSDHQVTDETFRDLPHFELKE